MTFEQENQFDFWERGVSFLTIGPVIHYLLTVGCLANSRFSLNQDSSGLGDSTVRFKDSSDAGYLFCSCSSSFVSPDNGWPGKYVINVKVEVLTPRKW